MKKTLPQPTVRTVIQSISAPSHPSPARRWLGGLTLAAAVLIPAALLAPRAKSAGSAVAVQIANTAPVPVSDVSGTARTPFLSQVSVSLKTTDYIGETSFTVPTGKRLVLQSVNAEATMGGASDVPDNIRVYGIFNGGGYYIHHFRLDAREPNTNNYLCNEPFLSYYDGGTTVYVDLIRNTPGTAAGANVTLTGYLENP